MKINGLSVLNNVSQMQLLKDLNLKVGQKIIGKIINLSTDQAVLEIAGRPIQAKIEGNPPPAGSTQTFLVNTDEQGKVILKVLSNSQETAELLNANAGSSNAGINANSEALLIQKSIASALTKDGLPPTNENIEKVNQYLRDFQAKYQQPLNPKVFTFIMAQKWPVTPATVLASWVHQDPEVRELLWDKFQNALPPKEAAGFQSKIVLNMQSNTPEIAAKLRSMTGLKIQEFIGKLNALVQQAKDNLRFGPNSPVLTSKLFIPNELKSAAFSNIKNESKSKNEPESTFVTENNQHRQSNTKLPSSTAIESALSKSDPHLNSMAGGVKNQTASDTVGATAEKNPELDQEKIQSILDQNISLNKAILKETALNGSSNLIPLLVNDSQSPIRECFVQWKEEKSSNNSLVNDQVVYMTIPTDNLGDIGLALRIGSGATRINLRVNSEEVRRYFIQHAAELKEGISKENAIISVNLNETTGLSSDLHGVDLWM